MVVDNGLGSNVIHDPIKNSNFIDLEHCILKIHDDAEEKTLKVKQHKEKSMNLDIEN